MKIRAWRPVQNPQLRQHIDEPVFGFDSPAIVGYADDLPMVELLLELGADPNRRSDWWAGGFHPRAPGGVPIGLSGP